mgnify:CR=1 FL=1
MSPKIGVGRMGDCLLFVILTANAVCGVVTDFHYASFFRVIVGSFFSCNSRKFFFV